MIYAVNVVCSFFRNSISCTNIKFLNDLIKAVDVLDIDYGVLYNVLGNVYFY